MPLLVGCLIFVAGTSLVGLAAYFASYRLLAQGRTVDQVKDLKEAVGNLFRVVGWLLSLLLALTFAEVFREWIAIDTAIEGEAMAILDTHDDLRRLGDRETRDARKLLLDYVHALIDDDWIALADDRLSPRADASLQELKDAILDLEPGDANDEMLGARIVADMDRASDFRLSRLQQAQEKPPFVLVIVLFGYLITMVCFGVYRPQLTLVILISLYTLFVGVVLYLILAMSDPFQGTIGVDPAALEYALEQIKEGG